MSKQFAGHRIYFPQYRRGKVGLELFEGTILEHARKLGIEIRAECGGQGTCGTCVVRIERGQEALEPPTPAEQQFKLGGSERLACQAKIVQPADIYVFIRDAGKYSILSETVQHEVELEPLVQNVNGEVVWSGPDGERVLGPHTGRMYGLAIDVGTTTVVVQLCDLQTGEQLTTFAIKNPQVTYGDDVISRIDYTMRNEGGLQELQTTAIEAVNEIIEEIVEQEGLSHEQIYETVIVGNPTMRNLFFGLPVESLGVIPFDAPDKRAVSVKASALGLKTNPEANVYGAALIGGHAGADCIANIIAARIHEAEKPTMLIDIGTNGELAIGTAAGIMTASVAAGGAYEGATVASGVGALDGAICNVQIRDGQISYQTINDKPPLGICGSGLIDLLAELLNDGIMTSKAKLNGDYYLTETIKFTQEDVYQLITAKAGLRTDQDLLISYYGIELADVDRLYLSGGFGNYIDENNAITIGLLPDVRGKVVKIGNAALAGAAEMLLSRRRRQESEVWAAKIRHTRPNELEPEFAYMVADNMYF